MQLKVEVCVNTIFCSILYFFSRIYLAPKVFEKYSKNLMRFHFWHFSPIFVHLDLELTELTCLVTLFDRKLQVGKLTIFWHF